MIVFQYLVTYHSTLQIVDTKHTVVDIGANLPVCPVEIIIRDEVFKVLAMSDNLRHDNGDEVTERPSQVPVDSDDKLLGAAQPQ